MYLKISTQEEIDAFARSTFPALLEQSTQSIRQELEKHPNTIENEFLQAIDGVLIQGEQMQKRKEKGKLAFLHIFYLKSALLTGKYELQIQLFNDQSYGDSNECYGFWIPTWFQKRFEEDAAQFNKKAAKQLISFGEAKQQAIKMRYYDFYLAMMGQFLLEEVPEIIKLPSFQKIEKEEGMQLLFGGYLDQAILLCPPFRKEASR